MTDIENKKKQKEQAEQIARDYLKPECDHELTDEEYPLSKDDD
tara:strand:- start:150 stop:278 length:129 start_codon:yes stop_codon:yes gene_type:complete